MKQFKVVCNTCDRGFAGETQESVHQMARLHAQSGMQNDMQNDMQDSTPTHPTEVSFKYVALETYTLVFGDRSEADRP